MGLWSTLFSSKDEGSSDIKVRHTTAESGKSRVEADRYTHTGHNERSDRTHVHENYKLDHDTGKYSEYRGGENSGDRSYNKK